MQTGNFGQVREAYVAARQEFPQDVITYILSRVSSASPSVLDIGCGTGIATRQFAAKGVAVMGSDIDYEMIRAARQMSPDIPYTVALAQALPFEDGNFDVVTAFSAFHWFQDDESLGEIQRVLKRGGQFFVINNNDVAGFRVGYRRKLEKLLNKRLPSPKDVYDPTTIFREAGFAHVATRVFKSEKQFRSEDALRHIQSAAVWNEVPKEREQEASELMREHIVENMVDGRVVRYLDVVVVSGSVS